MAIGAKQAAFGALRWLPKTRIPALFGLRFGGLGSIFGLHSVPRTKGPSLSFMSDMDISAAFVEQMLLHYRRRGYDILSMNEVHERLTEKPSSARFVAFTFDDGYRNNFDVVYPLFRKYGAPFTVYVATDLIEGTRLPVWYVLQDLLVSRTSIEVELDGQRTVLAAGTREEKESAASHIAVTTAPLDGDALDTWFRELFLRYGLDLQAKTREHMMSWDMVREIANSKEGTIGAHGVSHIPLKPLGAERMHREVSESKKIIEARTGVPVQHFCYPFGGYEQVGERETAYVARSGYLTGLTTRTANVFPGHRAHLTALPRQVLSGAFEDLGIVETMASGLPSALLYGFRRVITHQGGLKRFL